MKIQIYRDAPTIYRKRCNIGPYPFNPQWFFTLEKIAGKTLEVDTQYLFSNRFNTLPITDVSNEGLQIESYLVEQVLNDGRVCKGYCLICAKTLYLAPLKSIPNEKRTCPKCGSIGHIQPFV